VKHLHHKLASMGGQAALLRELFVALMRSTIRRNWQAR
jgi:hypothetical protein